jgi:hypothetical protein
VSILTYAQRLEHWNWCREFIDREAIYRIDESHPKIPGKAPGSMYVWQFYLRRATLNPQFAYKLGLLFWDHFLPVYQQQPFQICACHPSGPPIAAAILATAGDLAVALNVFLVRREPKQIGTDNWFDGHALPDVPVLMVDDAAASAPFLMNGALRVQNKLRLPLHYNYFTILNKVGRNVPMNAQHTDSYLDGQLISLYTLNHFCKSAADFADKYGKPQGWTGLIK